MLNNVKKQNTFGQCSALLTFLLFDSVRKKLDVIL